jgi:hypothetical protein
MSFVGNYEKFFPEKMWTSITSYSDFIKHLVNKHAPGGSYSYDDGDMRRGYFMYQDKMYMIRTWTIHDTPKGVKTEYSIYDAHLTIQEAMKNSLTEVE